MSDSDGPSCSSQGGKQEQCRVLLSSRYCHTDIVTKVRTQKRSGYRSRSSSLVFDPSYKRWLGVRKLKSAVNVNDVERVRVQLEEGVDPNVADKYGRTPLHLASAKGYTEVVRLLLKYQANVHKLDSIGNTPLHLAVCLDSKETVNLLLKAGASVLAEGVDGCTPLKLAQSKLRMLQNHTSEDCSLLKSHVTEVIASMMKLLEDSSKEAELVSAFQTRLQVSQTSDQVTDDLKQLLENLDKLNLNKPQQQNIANEIDKRERLIRKLSGNEPLIRKSKLNLNETIEKVPELGENIEPSPLLPQAKFNFN